MLRDLSSIVVEVPPIVVTDDDVDAHIEERRRRRAGWTEVERPAADGDVVRLNLRATLDGADFDRSRAEDVSHTVGTDHLLPGLDEAVGGMRAGQSVTIRTTLVGGEFGGREAELTITVRSVWEQRLPEVAAEARARSRERVTRDKISARFREACAAALAAAVSATGVPVPAGLVHEEVELGKRALGEGLRQAGVTLGDYLSIEHKTEEELDRELSAAGSLNVGARLVLDALADAENIEITDAEIGRLAGLRQAGSSREELRRAKALAVLMRRITIKESGGGVLTLAELTGQPGRNFSETAPVQHC